MPYDYYQPQGDFYKQLAAGQQQDDPWAPAQQEMPQQGAPQSDPWAIKAAPPPQPLQPSLAEGGATAEAQAILNMLRNQPQKDDTINFSYQGQGLGGGGASGGGSGTYGG